MTKRRLVPLGFFAIFTAATCLEAADLQIPPEIQNAVSLGFPWVQPGFDAAGNLYVASVVDLTGARPTNATLIGPACITCLVVAKISSGGLVHMTAIGGLVYSSEQFAMFGDLAGDVFLAGGFAGSSFPTTAGAFETTSATGGAYLLKLDPSGTKLLYSTFIGSKPLTTLATAITLDRQGNIYVAGDTEESTFPTTPGALQPSGSKVQGVAQMGFVSKFDPAGKLVASTLFGGEAERDYTQINSMAVDSAGVIHIAGEADGLDFPTTPGAPYTPGRGFVARLNSSLSELIYSTRLPDTPRSIQASNAGDSYVAGEVVTKIAASGAIVYQTPLPTGGVGLLLLKDGTLAVAGAATGSNFPTKDTLQPCLPDRTQNPFEFAYPASGVFAVLDPAGQVTFSTFLGGAALTQIIAIVQNPSGSLYLAGWTNATDFPGGPILVGDASWGVAFVFKLDLSAVPQGLPSPSCLSQSTAIDYAPAVPGMISTLYGSNLGPPTGTSFQLDANGKVPTQTAGTSVSVGGLAAPVLYAQDGQINFIVPQEVAEQTTNVCVATAVGQSCIFANVASVYPGIFYTPGVGYAVLNQDGTLNAPSNPALRGSSISLFGTGMGLYDRSFPDGSIVGLPLANVIAPVSALFLDPYPYICRCQIPSAPTIRTVPCFSQERLLTRW